MKKVKIKKILKKVEKVNPYRILNLEINKLRYRFDDLEKFVKEIEQKRVMIMRDMETLRNDFIKIQMIMNGNMKWVNETMVSFNTKVAEFLLEAFKFEKQKKKGILECKKNLKKTKPLTTKSNQRSALP